jgi:acyl carrier protein
MKMEGTMDQDFKKLRDIIADVMGIDAVEITTETTFDDDLGADSLDVASIIMAIEDEYDVKVDTDVAAKVKTVGDALALIKGASEG